MPYKDIKTAMVDINKRPFINVLSSLKPFWETRNFLTESSSAFLTAFKSHLSIVVSFSSAGT